MPYNLSASIHIDGSNLDIYKPEICPYCKKGIDAIIINKFVKKTSHGCVLYVAMGCPICGEVFFCKYLLGISVSDAACLRAILPWNQIIGGDANEEFFSNEINKLSPMFVEIYNQSYKAEQNGLDKICGAGYRKAFEYLMKDYAIFMDPKDEAKIVKMQLIDCIKYAFTETEMGIFERATWLGNDQTHYSKNHESYDITDLKKIIHICVNRIESKYNEKFYLEEIRSAKKKEQKQ